jgi:hypothetical protein
MERIVDYESARKIVTEMFPGQPAKDLCEAGFSCFQCFFFVVRGFVVLGSVSLKSHLFCRLSCSCRCAVRACRCAHLRPSFQVAIEDAKVVRDSGDGIVTNNLDLSGIAYLWAVATGARSQAVANQACIALIKLHVSLGAGLQEQAASIQQSMIEVVTRSANDLRCFGEPPLDIIFAASHSIGHSSSPTFLSPSPATLSLDLCPLCSSRGLP